MNATSDTLDIQPLRPAMIPMADVAPQPPNNPGAAEAARARIAAIDDVYPIGSPADVPAVATTELVTDRDMLARTYRPQPEAIRRRDLPAKLKPVLGALGVFALALLLFKSPVVLSQVQYALAKPAPAASSAPVASAIIPAEATLTIPKINVHTPVNYEPSTDETKIQTALETGVVHYGNTALPGQAGNSVIFGHSSNDWWEPGNYKFVFVLLDKLVAGDRFSVDYQSKRYTYEVAESRVVEPTDLSVLAPSAEPTMTLITCTPPGTSWKRLIVTAKQVDPDPSLASQPAANTSKSGANLPGSAPGFWQQIGQAWAGIAHGFSSLFGADNSQPTPTSSPAPGQLPTAK